MASDAAAPRKVSGGLAAPSAAPTAPRPVVAPRPVAAAPRPEVPRELDLEKLFYTPAFALLEEHKFKMAAGLFLQALNLARESKMSKEVIENYQGFYNLAMSEAKKADELVAAQAAQGGGGGGRGGKGGGKKDPPIVETPLFKDGKPTMTFADLAGMVAEKGEITQLFVLPNQFPKLLAPGTGMLFYGPPGTGKSYIIPAIANEVQASLGGTMHLFIVSPADIRGKFVGDTERNLKRYWEHANAAASAPNSKSIIFMDEFDALGGSREKDDTAMNTSVTMLLQLLQGAGEGYPNVIFMAATNFPWRLDAAVLRRFSIKIFLDLPGSSAIRSMVEKKLEKRVHPDACAQLESRCDAVVKMLSMSTTGRGGLRDLLVKTAGIPAAKVDAFLEVGEHEGSDDAVSLLGMSSSDVTKIVDIALNRVGMRILTRKDPSKNCYPIPSADCTSDCRVCELTPEERARFVIRIPDVKEFFDEFRVAALQFGSNVNQKDYVDLLIYKLTGVAPKNSQ